MKIVKKDNIEIGDIYAVTLNTFCDYYIVIRNPHAYSEVNNIQCMKIIRKPIKCFDFNIPIISVDGDVNFVDVRNIYSINENELNNKIGKLECDFFDVDNFIHCILMLYANNCLNRGLKLYSVDTLFKNYINSFSKKYYKNNENTNDVTEDIESDVINNEESIKTPQKKNIEIPERFLKKEMISTNMNSLPKLTKKWSRYQLHWFRAVLDKYSVSELATICAEMPDKWIRSTHSHKKYLINRLDEDTKYYYYLDSFISRLGNSNVVTKIDVPKDLPHHANYIDHSTAAKLFKAVKDMGIKKVSNYVNNFGYLELLQLYADLLLEYSFINPKDYSKNELTYIIGKKEKNINVKNRAIGEAMRRGIYDRIVKKLKNRSYEYYEYLFADEKGE